MKLPRTRTLLPRVDWRETAGSTNAELRMLVEREGSAVPHGALVATADQTLGRGRQGRGWETPPGTAIAASLLVRGYASEPAELVRGYASEPTELVRGFGDTTSASASADAGSAPLPLSWLPLLAGSAVVGALQPLFQGDPPLRVGVKWPNDVHVRDETEAELGSPGRKLCGILCEVLPDGSVIVGTGINLLIPDWQLPTERASSVLAAGGDVGGAESLEDEAGQALADRVLADVAGGVLRIAELARSDPHAARARVLRHSLTLGTEVRVHLPGGEIVDGRARALADDGSLIVDLPTGGRLTVSAADVEHLR